MAALAKAQGRFHSPRRIIAFVANGMFYAPDVLAAAQASGAIVLPVNLSDYPTTAHLLDYLAPILRQHRFDYALTFNHFGVDAQGLFLDFLTRFKLPLASWFVDDPKLILHSFQGVFTPQTVAFATGRAATASLAKQHQASFYLPLATDLARFTPKAARLLPDRHPAHGRACFIGISWSARIREKRALGPFPARLCRHLPALAQAYLDDPGPLPSSRLDGLDSQAAVLFAALPPQKAQAYDVIAAWLANRRYRVSHVLALAHLAPLVIGDKLWDRLLASTRAPYAYQASAHYHTDLPAIYAAAAACIDIPSSHMQGALSQRFFDAPAAGCPVVAHANSDLAGVFEPDNELLTYACPDELTAQTKRLLHDRTLRTTLARNARRTVLAKHTWQHRLTELDSVMGKFFG